PKTVDVLLTFPERELPHSKDAEMALLSAILLDESVLHNEAVRLDPEDFYRKSHQRIFEMMRKMSESSMEIDFATLAAELERTCWLEEVGGRPYLQAILDFPRSVAV